MEAVRHREFEKKMPPIVEDMSTERRERILRMMTTADTDMRNNAMIAMLMLLIATVGIIGNAMIIIVYLKDSVRRRRHVFVINLGFMQLVFALMIAFIALRFSNPEDLWSEYGSCMADSFGMSVLTLGCIFQFAAIAVDRALIVYRPYLSARSTYAAKIISIAVIYILSVALSLPVLLEWTYVHRLGYLKFCSFDFTSHDIATRTYVVVLFTVAFLLPSFVICIAYGVLFFALRNRRQMKYMRAHRNLQRTASPMAAEYVRLQAETNVTLLLVAVLIAFFVAWSPFAVVAMISQIGWTPSATAITVAGIMAKAFVICHPLIYLIKDKQFRLALSCTALCCSFNDPAHKFANFAKDLDESQSEAITNHLNRIEDERDEDCRQPLDAIVHFDRETFV